jgi:adhesin transport system outer membrane protein
MFFHGRDRLQERPDGRAADDAAATVGVPFGLGMRRVKPRKSLRYAGLVGGLAGAIVATGPARAVSLEEALADLVANHPQLRAARDTVDAAGETVRTRTGQFLPQVRLNTDYGFKDINSPSLRSSGDSWHRPFDRYTMTVTQNLFDGSRKTGDKQGAEAAQDAARADLRTTRLNLQREGAGAYMEVIRQNKLVAVSRKSESTIALQLNLEDERVQKGAGTAVDVLFAKTRLQLAKERRIVFEGSLRDSITRYAQVFGYPPTPNDLTEPPLPVHLVPESLGSALRVALKENPLIDNSNHQIEIARIGTKTAGSGFFPRVDVVGAANYEDDREGTAGFRRDWSVALQATWDIFSGFATRASVAEASYTYSSRLFNHLFVNRQVEQEVRLAWQGVITSCERRLLLDNAVTIAEEVYRSRLRLREAGQETAINVLDAETEVLNSQTSLAQAQTDEALAIYRLIVAMGHDLVGALTAPVGSDAERQEAQSRHDAMCLDRMKTIEAAPRATPASLPAQEGANPFNQSGGDGSGTVPALPTSPVDQAPVGGNPFDQPAGQGGTTAPNPFDQSGSGGTGTVPAVPVTPVETAPVGGNPFDKPAGQSGAVAPNPFDQPAGKSGATAPNPFDQPAGQSSLTKPGDPSGTPEPEEQTGIEREPAAVGSASTGAAMSRVLAELDDELDVSRSGRGAATRQVEFQSDDGITERVTTRR